MNSSSKETNKTLKEILRNKQIYNFNGTPQTFSFMENEIQTAVKEWLNQKPMLIVKDEKTKTTTAYLNRDELMEDLK
jgi:hypothetical protein